MNVNPPRRKGGLFRKMLGLIIILIGIVIFLAPTTILIWGAVENWTNPCEERLAKKNTGSEQGNSNTIDKQKQEADVKSLCAAIRQKDIPMLIVFGVLAFSGVILAIAGVFLFRGRREKPAPPNVT